MYTFFTYLHSTKVLQMKTQVPFTVRADTHGYARVHTAQRDSGRSVIELVESRGSHDARSRSVNGSL